MPNHIQRVYSFRITADEINQIMGCRPNKLTDSDIEFINDKIAEQMDALRNNVIGVIVQAKNAYKEREKQQAENREYIKKQQERNWLFSKWCHDNPGKKPVNFCSTCNLIMDIPMSPQEHQERYGHEHTGL